MEKPNYLVTMEAAWVVKDVKSVDDAIGVAIAEAGKRLNPKLDFVELEVETKSCPFCGGELDGVFMVAKTALVGILMQMKVFEAENEEHASRIAKSVVGSALRNIPLEVVDVKQIK
ncbi:MAG: DUF555 domain-containing protein [Methermicoccaceae archaeon]